MSWQSQHSLRHGALLILAGLALSCAAPGDVPTTLRSASELDYPPYAVVTADGEAAGLGVDVLRAAAGRAGLAVDVGVGPWAEIKAALIDGELDVLPLVARTPEREAVMDFTRPYLTLRGAVVVRKGDSAITSIDDLRGREIALLAGGAADEYARRNALSNRLVPVRSNAEALRALSFGDVEAVLLWRSVGARLIDELGLSNLTLLDLRIDGFSQAFCLAVAEGDQALRSRLDQGLAEVLADGTLAAIEARWLGTGAARTDRWRARVWYPVLIAAVLSFAGAGLWWRRRRSTSSRGRD